MTIIHQSDNEYLLRLDKNEDCIKELEIFARTEKIQSATFTIIGACKQVTLSFYNLENKTYEDHLLEKDLEITSVTGNIAWMDMAPIIHTHGTFADSSLHVFGGHIKSLVISATGEILLQILDKKILREYDTITGLNLLRE